ncbi:DUF4055 domain-containing protein [uncultured Desulfovibrio sp.]|uniref:DUF4055 domain-containing protein n=1 Tax=uncultured Desulfovibrio sp. TaxID=167968 RepID=UPI00272AE0E7|nr:DUF4055 domain-containing protein [uncultured Desulfovibrio sp.]
MKIFGNRNAQATVDTRSDAFSLQLEDQRLPHDLMGGTKAMIRAGRKYIPQEVGEDEEGWRTRLERTILFNVFRRTLCYMGGRVFEKPVSLGEDADEAEQIFTENVDKRGQNLTVWSRKVFEHGLCDGVTFCLVDYDDVQTRTENGVRQFQRPDGEWEDRTEAADRKNGWRPYFVHVPAENVLDARVTYNGGKARVSHFRYVETAEEADGLWGSRRYQRIRVFYLDEGDRPVWEVWENSEEGKNDFVKVGETRQLSLDEIPLAVFMPGDRRTDMTAEPALIDLAMLNKRHWQATSAQFDLMEYVRRPPWFGRKLGIWDADTGERKVTFGAGILCDSDDDGADLRSVGVDPASVEAGRQELKDLEENMALYGLQLLQPKSGVITATESNRDSEENNSTLKAWALQFQDFLENAMRFVALWRGEADGPSVKVNTEFANSLDAQFLLEMRRAGEISRETYLNLVKGLGIFPDDFDVQGEADRLAQELMVNGGQAGVTKLGQALAGAGM